MASDTNTLVTDKASTVIVVPAKSAGVSEELAPLGAALSTLKVRLYV